MSEKEQCAEAAVRKIRREMRRRFSAEENIRIVLERLSRRAMHQPSVPTSCSCLRLMVASS